MKKLSIILLLLALIVSMFVFVSCKDSGKTDNPDSGNEQVEPGGDQDGDDDDDDDDVVIALSAKTLTIEEYKSAKLEAVVSGSSESIVWTSSDTSIATVDGGNVSGIKEGTATIRATVGDEYDECTVTVTKTTVVASLEIQETVSIERGDKFESDIKAKWGDEDYTESVTYSYAFAEGLEDICTVSFENGKITITGTKAGNTTVTVAAEIRGQIASKDIAVTVTEPVLSLSVDGDVVSTAESNTVSIYTVEEGDKKTSATIKFNASYMKNQTTNVDVTFGDFSTADVATISDKTENGYTITKAKAGVTEIVASYTTDGKTETIKIKITVAKIEKTLDYSPTIDISKTTTISVPETLTGEVTEATIGDIDVFSSFASGVITLNKDKLPKKAADLGENKAMVISTADYIYNCTANIYSMVISTKADLEAFAADAKNNGDFTNTGVLDGYYVLGNDIDFNDKIESATYLDEVDTMAIKNGGRWNQPEKFGFKGVFDGKSYNIDGLTVATKGYKTNLTSGGFIGYINDAGIVKNISFTNAGVWENCGFICSYGGGTIENVSVSYKNIGVGNSNDFGRKTGTFFSFNNSANAKVVNCVVDASKADIKFAKNDNNESNLRLGTAASGKQVENLIIIADKEEYLESSGATTKVLTYSALSDDTVKSAVESLPNDKWTVINGIPFLKHYAESIDQDKEIAITTETAEVYGGNTLEIEVNETYFTLSLKAEYAGITLNGNIITVAEDVEKGTITIVAKSLINDSEDEKVISVYPKGKAYTISEKQILDLNAAVVDGAITVKDVTIDLSSLEGFTASKTTATVAINKNNYEGTISGTTLTVTGIAKEVYGEYTATITVGADTITLPVLIATKVITTAEEFKAINTIAAELLNNGYYVLGNDITEAGEYSGVATNVVFKGVLDGNGHKIAGLRIKVANQALFGDLYGTIKNIMFENFYLYKWSRIIAKANHGTFENIYFEFSSDFAACDGGINCQWGGDKLILANVVFDLSNVSGATDGMTLLGKPTAITSSNVVVIAKSTLKGISNSSTDGKDFGIYVYYADTHTTNGIAIPTDTWDSAYWTVKDGSIPVFKGMTAPSMSATFETVTEQIEAGGSGTVTLGENCVLVDLPEGLTYENGKLKVPTDATAGTTYTITAKNIYDISQKVERTITVKEANKTLSFTDRKTIDLGATVETVDESEVIKASDTITLDLSDVTDLSVTEETDAIVTINSIDYKGTISIDKIVTITGLTTAVYGEYDAEVKFANTTVTGKVLVATKVITTMAEFKSINILAKALSYNGYYLLGDNINEDKTITGGDRNFLAENQIGESTSTPFLGTIDGNGYNVNYLCMEKWTLNGWIYELRGTVKNIGFTHLTLYGSMYFIYRCLGGGKIENVYVQLDNATSAYSIFGHSSAGENFTFKNVVVDVTTAASHDNFVKKATSNTGWTIFRRCIEPNQAVTFTNTVVIGLPEGFKDRIGQDGSGKVNYDGADFGIYASYADGTTNDVTFPESNWDTTYWTVDGTAKTVKWKNA